MSMKRAMPLVLAATAFALAGGAGAQSCSGFGDVNASESICTDITWLKNRGITQGCTQTEYCPDAPVNRLAMAAFMNRLGDVMQPLVLSTEESGAVLSLAQSSYLCQTPDAPARTYRRRLIGDASLSFAVTGQQDLFAVIVFSTDGGMTWNPIGTNVDFGAGLRGDESGRQHAHAQTTRAYDGHPTIVRRYALHVGGGTSAATISGWTCQLLVTLQNEDE